MGDAGINRQHQPQIRDFHHHPRDWREFRYVYPVLSRRSRGLSIGVNLNPDMACNFDCIYCQVDRTVAPRTRRVDLDRLRDELDTLLATAVSGRLFDEPEFAETPAPLRRLNDIAFSGDGEPTTCPVFAESVRLAAELKDKHTGGRHVKLVLITDACYLTRPDVIVGLGIMDRSNGRVWAKLDAGTEEYYRIVNRPNFPLEHVIDNIVRTARVRPVTIQSLFMRIHGRPPDEAEIIAYTRRLNDMTADGAELDRVQVYTVARRPAQSHVTALSDAEVDAVSDLIRNRTGLTVESYNG